MKCDENKPFCWRCVKAGRLCGGYSHETALQFAIRDGIQTDKNTNRLAHLAFHVLSLDINGQPLQRSAIWGYSFLQLCNSVSCVRAAAAAFGAAYEASLQDSHTDALTTWKYYGQAVQQLRSHVADETASPESLAIASITLACAESLSQHEQNALVHLQGASQVLDNVNKKALPHTNPETLAAVTQELSNIGILIASHVISEVPSFLQFEPQKASCVSNEVEQATKSAFSALQNAYRFVGVAAPRRYVHPSWVDLDTDLCRYRDEILAELRSAVSALQTLSAHLQTESPTPAMKLTEAETIADVYALRCQLTLPLIFISSIHSAYETSYDRFQCLFQEIVRDAAASIRLQHRFKTGVFSRFSARPGILSPLFFAAMKCRNKSLRTVAIDLMRGLGRQGPADGHTMAAIAMRLAEIETPGIEQTGDTHDACDVLEEQRVHGYSFQTPPSYELGRQVLQIEFSKPDPPLSQGWGQVDYSKGENWKFWTESLFV